MMNKRLRLAVLIAAYAATAIAAPAKTTPDALLTQAKQLGWIPADNICKGYFADDQTTALNPPPPLNSAELQSLPAAVSADHSELVYNGVSTLDGNISISQAGRTITAKKARLDVKEGDFEKARLTGDVTFRETGRLSIAQTAILDLKQKWYSLKGVVYRLFVGNSLSAWGNADSAAETPGGIAELKNVSFSTCPPQNRAWVLTAERLSLDRNAGKGRAYQAVLYAKNMPILYAPYFNFPLDNRRLSGFLYPKFLFGSESGFGIGMPFYWNIAPNIDDTAAPSIFTKRGFLLNNQMRYLTSASRGELTLAFLPNDREFRRFQKTASSETPENTPGLNKLSLANPFRSFISWQNSSDFPSGWSNVINYSRVSDDYYVHDIGGVPLASHNQILQQGKFFYNAGDFNFMANFQGYQTLHPVNEAFAQNQYSMLPQLLLTARPSDGIYPLNYQAEAELVNFSENRNPGQLQTPPSGQRLNLTPSISLPLRNALGFFTPAITYEMTQYHLNDQPAGFQREINRILPIFNIDSGLYAERGMRFLNHNYTQTLEPRLFYLYAPFRDQSEIPVFDSGLQPFNFNQLFLINRFSGADRISDANQISAALSSRLLDAQTGDEKISADIGIIKYFHERKVSLCQTPLCLNALFSDVGFISPQADFSPAAGQIHYRLTPSWEASINGAWDASAAQMQNAGMNVQYKPINSLDPSDNRVFNLGYQFVRHADFFTLPANALNPAKTQGNEFNLSEPSTSLAWPLNDQWRILGSVSYTLNQHHPLTYFGGVEYNSCCWAIQAVLAKSFSGFNAFAVPEYNTGVYIQFAFKGLSKIDANDPEGLLSRNIPGYTDRFASL